MIPKQHAYEGRNEDPVFFSHPRQTIDGSYLIATKFSEKHLPQIKVIVNESRGRAQFTPNLSEDDLKLLVNDVSRFINTPLKDLSQEDKNLLAKYPLRHIPVEERKVALSILNELGDCVGFIYLESIHWVNRTTEAHLALLENLGQELTKDAIGLAISYAKNVLNLRKLSIETATDETIYLSMGFVKIGTLTEHNMLRDKSMSDVHIYDMVL